MTELVSGFEKECRYIKVSDVYISTKPEHEKDNKR